MNAVIWLWPFVYFFGALPVGLVAHKFYFPRGKNHLEARSHRVFRYIVLCLDFLKGLLPVLLARSLPDFEQNFFILSVAVILGHCFPVWRRFQGGQGFFVSLAIIFSYSLPLGIFCLMIFALGSALKRTKEMAAPLAMSLAAVLSFWVIESPLMITLGVGLALIIWINRAKRAHEVESHE